MSKLRLLYMIRLMTDKSSKIIVTGGAGFIGSNLVDGLVNEGYSNIHVIDNLVAGKEEYVNPSAQLHKLDIRDFDAIVPIFQGARFVFHLAALPRVQPSILDPRTTHDVNVTGTLNVFLAARDGGVRRVIYSASSSAYGDQKTLPLKEEMEACPQSPYGLQKYEGELLARLFSELYGLETVSLRYFNVYGPRAASDGAYALVIAIFLNQRKKGEPMTIVPDGTQSRDYTHVSDVVRANILAATSSNVGKGEVINIGGGHNRTVLEVAKFIGGPTVFIEHRIEPKHTFADISLAKNLLGWKPEVNFEEGIQELKKMYGLTD